jgi:hypothetical protein
MPQASVEKRSAAILAASKMLAIMSLAGAFDVAINRITKRKIKPLTIGLELFFNKRSCLPLSEPSPWLWRKTHALPHLTFFENKKG